MADLVKEARREQESWEAGLGLEGGGEGSSEASGTKGNIVLTLLYHRWAPPPDIWKPPWPLRVPAGF